MTDDQIIDLASLVVTGNMTNIETYRLPEDGAYRNERIQGMSVLVPDLAANSQYLQEYIYGESAVSDQTEESSSAEGGE